MGRTPRVVKKVFESPYNGKTEIEVALFPWEKLDAVQEIQQIFNINN
jgi:S-adenosylmethionine synthetase